MHSLKTARLKKPAGRPRKDSERSPVGQAVANCIRPETPLYIGSSSAAPAHAGIAGTRFKLFPTVSPQISAIRPEVLTIVTQIAAITPDVTPVTANIALFAASCFVISPPNILAHHAPIFRNVTVVAANVTPVTPPVGAVMTQVAAITPDVPPLGDCVLT